MEVYKSKAYCLFSNAAGGINAGGCTKEWLDINAGDPAKLFLEGTYDPMYSYMSPREYALWAFTPGDPGSIDMDLAYVAGLGSSETGMAASLQMEDIDDDANDPTKVMHEITATGNVRMVSGVEVNYLTINSVVDYGSHMVVFTDENVNAYAGQRIWLHGMPDVEEDKWVTILNSIYGDPYFEVGPSILTAGTGLTAYALPAVAEIHVGGAFASLQDALDEGDGEFNDCWVFTNSDITGYDHTLYTGDGDHLNNTKKYIVGYKTNCFDALPAGYGYWDESLSGVLPNGANYKTAEQWHNGDHSDSALSAALVKIESVDQTKCTFDIDALSAENIVFMGFYYATDGVNYLGIVGVGNTATHYSSLSFKHCVHKSSDYDAQLAADWFVQRGSFVVIGGYVRNIVIDDCTMFGGQPVWPATNYGDIKMVEIQHSWFTGMNAQIASIGVQLVFHHNVLVRCKRGLGPGREQAVTAFNNTFYDIRESMFWMAGSGAEECKLRFYNNIVVTNYFEPGRNPLHNDARAGVFFELGGGTYDGDYNCYRDISDVAATWKATAAATNANWVEPSGGQNSIEVDPMFADAANFDFRPRNPKVITGGKPSNGVVTYMGAVPPKHSFRTNARTANFGRMK